MSNNILLRKVTSPQSSAAELKNENRLGSECSGSQGVGRVLTLNNSSLTTENLTVIFRNGSMIMPSDVIITDKAASTTIKFNSAAIFNDDLIRVMYYV